MRRPADRDYIFGTLERTMRELGLRPRPQVHMFGDDGSYLGLVMAPDPAASAPEGAIGLLGVVPCELMAAHLFVLWEDADLPTLPSPAPAGEATVLTLEATQDGLWLSAQSYRAEPGPPGPHGTVDHRAALATTGDCRRREAAGPGVRPRRGVAGAAGARGHARPRRAAAARVRSGIGR